MPIFAQEISEPVIETTTTEAPTTTEAITTTTISTTTTTVIITSTTTLEVSTTTEPTSTTETTVTVSTITVETTIPEITTTIKMSICPAIYCDTKECKYGCEVTEEGCFTGRCKEPFVKPCPERCECDEFGNVVKCETETYCPPEPERPVCPDDKVRPIYDGEGCLAAYKCEKEVVDRCENTVLCKDKDGCCPAGCEERDSDCVVPGCDAIYCEDGKKLKCESIDNECICPSCPLPSRCREERDPNTGFIKVLCEGEGLVCPEISEEAEKKCEEKGGKPIFRYGPEGCKVFECRFKEVGTPVITPIVQCPTPHEVAKSFTDCEETGGKPKTIKEGGCKVVHCSFEKPEVCPPIDIKKREEMAIQCGSDGKRVREGYALNGCKELVCEEKEQDRPAACKREVPSEAVDKCEMEGGEFIVKYDRQGCIVFVDCLRRGDYTEVEYEEIEEIPDSAKLLGIAFKLEELRMELDKLARKTKAIANYYTSVKSPEEEKFQRVSGMFNNAMQKVNEIKENLRSRLDSLSLGDIEDFKYDIKYIRDVILKDILYLMLSASEDAIEYRYEERREVIKEEEFEYRPSEIPEGGNCGTDGGCFDRAFRICKPAEFYPDRDAIVKIAGLEDDKCVMKVRLREGAGPPAGAIPGLNPPYEMKCVITDYSFGVRGPEDIVPYCEGNLAELMKKFGPPPGSVGPTEEYRPREDKGFKEGPKPQEYPIYKGPKEGTDEPATGVRPCVGCLNNGICDVGECAGCPDCLT